MNCTNAGVSVLAKGDMALESFRAVGAFADRYDMLPETVGYGGFAVVKKCRDKLTGEVWAVKLLRVAADDEPSALSKAATARSRTAEASTSTASLHHDGERHPQLRESSREYIYNELRVLACIGEGVVDNALRLREFFEEPLSVSTNGGLLGCTGRSSFQHNVVYIVTELLSGGDLLSAVSNRGSLAEEDARGVFRSLMQCCASLERRGVIHRDLKLENVVLSAPHDFHKGVTLIDFGLATDVIHDGPATKVCGTPSNVAPEIIALHIHRARGKQVAPYGYGCDIWSAGVILYTLLSGYPPFDQAVDMTGLYAMILDGEYTFLDPAWHMVSESAKDLVTSCLCVDPSRRITASEALDHPWLQDQYQ